ncbi:MAG: hypothetical protein PWP57_130 [Candidatus Atribacteria bacterium]|nr:hypothetical protein [Candidatus Atribacteria bacterium]
MESKTRLYLIIFLAFYFLAVSMIITGAVIPRWMDDFSVSAGRAGRLFSFYYLPYTIVTFSSGLLSQRWGKKIVLLLGQAFLAGGFFAVSASTSFSLIEWGLFLLGIGGGFCEAPFTALLSQIFPGEEGYALNLSQISFGLGAASAPFLAGFLLEKGFSWRLFYLVPGLVTLLIFVLLSRERFPREKRITEEHYLLGPRGNGFIIASLLAMFLYVGAEIGSSSWITTYLVKGLGSNLSWGGVALAVFWGALTIGRFVFAFLSRSLSYPIILRFSSLLSLGFLLLLNFTHEIQWAVLALGGVGFGYSAIWPLIVAWVAQKMGEKQEGAIGFVVAFGGLGAMFFPWLGGVVGEKWGLSYIFWIVWVLVLFLWLVFHSFYFKEGSEEIGSGGDRCRDEWV